jgi:hypothetical protein
MNKMTIYVERFSVHKHYNNSTDYEWQVIDHEKMKVLCKFSSSGEYKDGELKKLAEKVAVYVDECVSNGEVSL